MPASKTFAVQAGRVNQEKEANRKAGRVIIENHLKSNRGKLDAVLNHQEINRQKGGSIHYGCHRLTNLHNATHA